MMKSWYRVPKDGQWGRRIHAVVIGDPTAKRRVRDFLRRGRP